MRLCRAVGRNPDRYVVFDIDVYPHEGIVTFWNAAEAQIFEREYAAKAEAYCDGHCTWLDHHPDCPIGGVK